MSAVRFVPLTVKDWETEGVPVKPVRLDGVVVIEGPMAEATWAAEIAKKIRTAASERGRKRKTVDGLRVITDVLFWAAGCGWFEWFENEEAWSAEQGAWREKAAERGLVRLRECVGISWRARKKRVTVKRNNNVMGRQLPAEHGDVEIFV